MKSQLRNRFVHSWFQPHMTLASCAVLLLFSCAANINIHGAASNSVARVWDERMLSAIRVDTPHPPAHARNLFSLSVCMYDAWAAYDSVAVGYVYHGKHTAPDVEAARREAISYAAYRILRERHFYSKTASTTLAADNAQMTALGYDRNNTSRDTSTPAGVGNSVYDAVSAWFINDGARQTNGTQAAPYPDYTFPQNGYSPYTYINGMLATSYPGTTDGTNNTLVDINRWQRLKIVNALDQNGFASGPLQGYLGAQWLGVRAFALTRDDPAKPWIDPGPPPHLNGLGDAEFRSNVVNVIQRGSELTPDDGVTMDISPGSFGNNSLGTSDGTGHPINPATGSAYVPNVVKRGDFVRVLAEFWADGPSSETPPGHWNVLANAVADNPGFSKQIGGTGPVVNDLEWDVKVYFALNAAVHDAACAAWSLKRYYDGWRPMSAIRSMGAKQSSDPGLPSFHTNGLPLIPGLIELVTTSTVLSGHHPFLTPGKIAILSWPGQPNNPVTTYRGVKWIHANSWVPYQRTNFVTPAFPGYISGHSTFSRSAAEVLAAITGSPFFPGGMATYTSPANTGLGFERGPSQDVQLQWATYYDAADQAGLSRIWGGIHPPIDDFGGRRAGSQAGRAVWALAQKYFDGSYIPPMSLALANTGGSQPLLSFTAPNTKTYSVLWKESLDAGSWTKLADVTALFAGQTLTIPDPLPVSEGRIFQLVAQQPGPVNPMPAILTCPKSVVADFGGAAALSVFAVGDGPLTWQWRSNGNIMPNVTGPVLEFTNAQFSDAGVYSVSVIDRNNTINSGPAYFAVRPRIIDQPRSQVVRRGDSVTLIANAEGMGPLNYRWRRQGRLIPGQTNPTLTLSNAQDSDAGSYSASITHQMPWGAGCTVISANAVVTILP